MNGERRDSLVTIDDPAPRPSESALATRRCGERARQVITGDGVTRLALLRFNNDEDEEYVALSLAP